MIKLLFSLVLTLISSVSFAASPVSEPVDKVVAKPVVVVKPNKNAVVPPVAVSPPVRNDGMLRNMVSSMKEEIRNDNLKSSAKRKD